MKNRNFLTLTGDGIRNPIFVLNYTRNINPVGVLGAVTYSFKFTKIKTFTSPTYAKTVFKPEQLS